MKDLICDILKISLPTLYVWKKNKHKMVISLFEDAFKNEEELNNWKIKNEKASTPILKNKEEISAFCNISSKNIYLWMKKRPLLFVLIEQAFNNTLNYSIDEYIDLKNNDIHRDICLECEDSVSAKMFEIDLFRSIFNPFISKETTKKLVNFKMSEKTTIVFDVLFEIKTEGGFSEKSLIALFLEKDKFEAFEIDEILELSKKISLIDKDALNNLLWDIFEPEETINVLKWNIKTMSYSDINLLAFSFSLGVIGNKIKKSTTYIHAHYTNILNSIEKSEKILFTDKVIDSFRY